jgi:RNA polymerase sigma-70 factor (ECF subfamily)
VGAAAEGISEWAAALRQHRPWLLRLLRRLTGDPALAQDLVQETFVKAIANRGPRELAKLRSWLAAIAINTARDTARKASRRYEVAATEGLHTIVDEAPGPQASLLRTEMNVCIAEFVDRLPRPQRQVVALHDLVDLTHQEIADRLAITEANSRVLLHRGRSNLRELLEEGCVLEFAGDPVPCERKPRADG